MYMYVLVHVHAHCMYIHNYVTSVDNMQEKSIIFCAQLAATAACYAPEMVALKGLPGMCVLPAYLMVMR